MKKGILTLLLVIAFLAGNAHFSHATLFLDDWGVSYGNWEPTGFGGSVNYVVEDWTGDPASGYLDPGYGGDAFDVEAVYFGLDDDYAYFAFVTGFPLQGIGNYDAGDIAIDWNGDGTYEYGIDTETGDLMSVTSWSDPYFTASSPYQITSGTTIENLGANYSYDTFDGRYAIEAIVDISSLGGAGLLTTDSDIHWTMSCGNDAGGAPAPVPEPATMFLLGAGFIGMAGLGRKRLFNTSVVK